MTDNAQNEQDRRQYFRIDMEQELIDIAWIDQQEKQQHQQLVCLDFSKGGIRIESAQTIALGTAVNVTFQADVNNQPLITRVLRCQRSTSGQFDIALRITNK